MLRASNERNLLNERVSQMEHDSRNCSSSGTVPKTPVDVLDTWNFSAMLPTVKRQIMAPYNQIMVAKFRS